MKQYKGYYIPNGLSGKRLFNCSDLIESCVAACTQQRVAVDGGAYVGYWSSILLKHFNEVVAIEPVPENVEYLRLNAPEAVVYTNALVDVPGTYWVHEDKKKGRKYSGHVSSEIGDLLVSGITLDDLGLVGVDFIKLDVEGGEFNALKGALSTIEAYRPVVVIEEKFDVEHKASALLRELGMRGTKITKADYIFTWR